MGMTTQIPATEMLRQVAERLWPGHHTQAVSGRVFVGAPDEQVSHWLDTDSFDTIRRCLLALTPEQSGIVSREIALVWVNSGSNLYAPIWTLTADQETVLLPALWRAVCG